MALRGTRPTPDELRAVAADSSALPELVDRYLDQPEFGATMRELHNESLLVRTDFYSFPAGYPSKAPLEQDSVADINRSLMEAPLALIEYVIMNGRPYSEIVTAPYTLADHIVAKAWGGMPYRDGGPEWQVTQHFDGRGNAGVLSDSWLFSRHSTTVSNASRGRANAISRALLCWDFLDRNVRIDARVNLADPHAVANAVKQNGACASCHQTLDPLAGFFGSYTPIYVPNYATYPIAIYMKDILEQVGAQMTSPAYFGQKGSSIEDLGRLIAADPRFSLCTVKRFYAFFHQIELTDVPESRAAELQAEFLDSGMNAKALARAIVLHEDFKVSYAVIDDGADRLIGVKKAGPEQLARTISALTGYRWMGSAEPLGEVELATDSFLGYKVLAGGIDAYGVNKPSRTFNATSRLFLDELAAKAANSVVESDFAAGDPSTRRLLGSVNESDTDERAIRAQLSDLHLALFAEDVAPDSDGVSESYALFDALRAASNDTRRAWKGTLTAMFQDFRLATY
jgi:hypothetical protein